MDEIIKVEETLHNVTIALKSGKKVTTPAKTIDTYYESGRKDCKIEMLRPINIGSKSQEI